jgi:hypothetical protein
MAILLLFNVAAKLHNLFINSKKKASKTLRLAAFFVSLHTGSPRGRQVFE